MPRTRSICRSFAIPVVTKTTIARKRAGNSPTQQTERLVGANNPKKTQNMEWAHCFLSRGPTRRYDTTRLPPLLSAAIQTQPRFRGCNLLRYHICRIYGAGCSTHEEKADAPRGPDVGDVNADAGRAVLPVRKSRRPAKSTSVEQRDQTHLRRERTKMRHACTKKTARHTQRRLANTG